MKIKRYKKVKNHMGFYVNNFGFRQPYQILVDGTFCNEALKNKINISDNIPSYLQSEIKLLTTPCLIIEMEKLSSIVGNQVAGALIILKKFSIHKCGHDKKPLSGTQCILSMLGKNNENHYVVATQDRDLENKVREIPGAPLLYLHLKTPVLEKPSDVSFSYAKEKLLGILDKNVNHIKKGGDDQEDHRPRKRKKKGPNPLSCKNKKKRVTEHPMKRKNEGLPEKEKIRRKRIKIPKHVREEWIKNKNIPS